MTTSEIDPRTVGLRLETLVSQVEAIADPHAREAARQLVAVVLDVHGAALERALGLIATGTPDAARLVASLRDDELIGPLLVLHGFEPEPEPEASMALAAPTAPRAVPVTLGRRPR